MVGSDIKRRHLLRATVMGGALAHFARLFANSPPPQQWKPLGDNLALVQGEGSNVLVFRGSDGVLMVDGGYAGQADNTMRLVRENFFATPQLLFNTHWHRGQTGCNAMLGKAGATIVAHENTKLWLGADVVSSWEKQTYKRLPEYARPNKTFFYGAHAIDFNNERIEHGYLPQGHTDGDMYVFLPNRNILVGGGVVAGNAYPVVDYVSGGWIGGMIDSLNRLIDLADNKTRIVPASGDPCRREDLIQQRHLCEDLIEKIATNYYSGLTYTDFVNSLPLDGIGNYNGSADTFLHTAYEGAWWHIRELRRFVRR